MCVCCVLKKKEKKKKKKKENDPHNSASLSAGASELYRRHKTLAAIA